jgi:hypothetical protein
MSEHTPTPWESNFNRIESKDDHGVDNDGWMIAECIGPEQEANAEFIVRACNAHDALVAACEKIEKLRSDLLEGATSMDEGALLTEGADAFDDIEAALKLAKGE